MSSSQNSKSSTTKVSARNYGSDWARKKFSISVNDALDNINSRERGANIIDLLDTCRNIHPRYGRIAKDTKYEKRFGSVDFNENFKACIDETTKKALTKFESTKWAEIVLSIIAPPPKTPFIRAEIPVVNTRMFVIAALLQQFSEIKLVNKQSLAEFCYLLVEQFGEELEIEEKIDYEDCLSKNGVELHKLLESTNQRQFEAENQSDYPSKDDSLSRKPLAEYIAKRLRFVYNRDIRENNRKKDKDKFGSFFMHIDGEWGSGKSTLLEFLQTALEKPSQDDPKVKPKPFSEGRWVVIKFNAWENQRLNPPWWFLMKKVFRDAEKALWRLSWKGYTQQTEKGKHQSNERKLRNLFRLVNLAIHENKWRFYTGGVYLVTTILTLVLTGVAIYLRWPLDKSVTPGKGTDLDWKKFPVVQLISLIAFIWSFVKLLRTGLLSGPAKAAQNFVQNSKDPMAALSRHFVKLTKRIGHPVAIFIDDLDRCNKDYGIKLLEGLQTIFRSAPVVYVVAADKRWLGAMYEDQYSIFAPTVAKPAKSFGAVFLDKTFQYTLTLPDISAAQKKLYWDKLLKIKEVNDADMSVDQQSKHQSHTGGPVNNEKKQRRIEEKIAAITIADEERTVEHMLRDFVVLIEPNPRAMKRLINDVSTCINLARLYGQRIDDRQLVLWTILRLQYPLLAAFFWDKPACVEKIHEPSEDKKFTGNTAYDAMLEDSAVRQLFSFEVKGEKIKLDKDFFNKMKFQE
jgi:hypothetical protein